MYDARYEQQTQLLLNLLPGLEKHPCFALKGGTAINLFIQDMPRVSVDIDLSYLPLESREQALAGISENLKEFAHDSARGISGAYVREHRNSGLLIRATIETPEATVKIEPNTILRGSVYPAAKRELVETAQRRFGLYVQVQALSIADLYGGKLCAALDRQHPRDLFDVQLLLDGDGITREIRRAFVIYLASHNRPMSELLDPNIKDISETFETQLVGMTEEPVSLVDLVETQHQLPRILVSGLDEDERQFLLSLKQGEPDWNRLGFDHLEQLPALQWKLQNIRKMDPTKHREMLERLERILAR
jgi:predicted nucleotidyltransferase component of viral defense system